MVLRSPIFALLPLCSLTFLWCAAELVLPPPLGANTGWTGGAECTGADFQPIPGDICICPHETTCIKDTQSLMFLAFARLSAYFDYPLYVLLFVSKAHNLRAAMHRSYLREFLPLDDLHELHVFAGKIVGLEVMWHSFWHLLRWGLAGDIHLAVRHVTGITGLVSLLLTPLIVWPMLFTRLRKGIDFRVRKWLHYLSIVWAVSICFHAPQRHIAKIMGSAVSIYLLDWLYGFCFKMVRIQTLDFTRIGRTVEVAWPNPEGFEHDGSGYVYICLPWISRVEWHAFSVMSHPTRPNFSCVCISAVGDWTKALRVAVKRPCSYPGWLYGPFPSPFSTATNYNNLIAVASGIGVTPSISTVVNLRETRRRVHLIWMCRDADLLEYFLKNVRFDDDAWSLIYYTGERNLVLEGMPENPMVRISLGRPQLAELILALVDNTTFGTPLPPELVRGANGAVEALPSPASLSHHASFCCALRSAMATYSPGDMHAMAAAFTKRTMGASATAAQSPPGGEWAFAVDPGPRRRPFAAADVSGVVDSKPLSPEGWDMHALAAAFTKRTMGASATAAQSPPGGEWAFAVDPGPRRRPFAAADVSGAVDSKPLSPEGWVARREPEQLQARRQEEEEEAVVAEAGGGAPQQEASRPEDEEQMSREVSVEDADDEQWQDALAEATDASAADASSPGGSAFASAVDLAVSLAAADGKKLISPEGLAQMLVTVCGISDGISGGELVRYFQSCGGDHGGPLSVREVGDLVEGLYEKTAAQAAAGTETTTSREIRLAVPGARQHKRISSRSPTASQASTGAETLTSRERRLSELGVQKPPGDGSIDSGIDHKSARRTSITSSTCSSTESTTWSRHYIENWVVMYCGGAAPVIKTLSSIHRDYEMPLKIESFAW